ncbi:MAG TPA: IclR family transcriptional regulator, partial [Actinoplanes sp.]|nr:IclR family transcriptional regulator [Actinoplanes sp.]
FTTHFAILATDEAVYVDKQEGRRPYQMPSRIGMSIALHTTAIGKAVLAELGDEEVLAICRRTGLTPRTPRTLTSEDALLAHLARVRVLGYAVDDEENEPGIRCVGAAVHDHTGRVLGGISVSTLAMDMDMTGLEERAPDVIAAAREVSAALGAAVPTVG